MARPKKPIDEQMLVRMAHAALQPSEMASVLGIEVSELLPFKDIIEAHWPDDEIFVNIRRNRLMRVGSPYPNKLRNRLRGALRAHIAEMVIREMGPLEGLIGYRLDDLLIEFDKKFPEGMSWDNWGKWHIDHIVPRAKFNTGQLRECFALANLRPLWASENLKRPKNG